MWEIAIALAKAILAERERREQAAANDELAITIINAVRTAIEQSTRQILEFLRQQHLDALASAVDGLFVTFVRYAADPRAEGNHDRLIRIIDDLAVLIPDMGRTLDRISSDERLAVNTFPTYASAVSLSVLAITERRYRFHVKEPFGGILQEAKRRALSVRDVLRRRSDMRFHFAVVTEEPGSVVFGYTFEGRFTQVEVVFNGQDPTAAREKVRRKMEARQDREFAAYPGVKELLDFLDALDDSMNDEVYRTALRDRELVDTDPSVDGTSVMPVTTHVAPRLLQ